jgi:predicted DsbA family dithiol-disulfide isomerase
MKLEFWLDYISPLCYQQHLVIEQLYKKYTFKDLELLYRSYEMIPSFEPEEDCTFHKVLSQHHVMTEEEVKELFKDMPKMLKPVKVHDAHRLSHLAKKMDKAFEYNKQLFKTYYVEKQDISNHDVLRKVAQRAGLDPIKVNEVLASKQFCDAVQMNRENAILKGIFEIPHMRIDGKMRLSGLHSEEHILEALTQASVQYVKTDYCEGKNCERKKTR